MKIQELVSGKKDDGAATVDGISVPVSVLKRLIEEGYTNIRFYRANKTFSAWGKSCTACFTEQEFRERK